MGSKQNILSAETSSIDEPLKGVSIRINAFQGYLHRYGLNTQQVAEFLGIDKQSFEQKLANHELFDIHETKKLTQLMGAKEAFHAFHYPTFAERERIYFETFGTKIPKHKNRKRRAKKTSENNN